jgi:prophage tail gpP-like protein
MLISQVTFEAGDGGRVTTLTLRRPDAFKPEPQVSSDVLWKELSHI